MHTLPMRPGPLSSGRLLPRRPTRVLGLAVACALALSGCSDPATTADPGAAAGSTASSSSESPSPTESDSPSTEATPYLPVRDGVELTAQRLPSL